MLNNPLCVKDGRFLYPIGTRGTTREKKSRRDQSHEEKNHRDRSLVTTHSIIFHLMTLYGQIGHVPSRAEPQAQGAITIFKID